MLELFVGGSAAHAHVVGAGRVALGEGQHLVNHGLYLGHRILEPGAGKGRIQGQLRVAGVDGDTAVADAFDLTRGGRNQRGRLADGAQPEQGGRQRGER